MTKEAETSPQVSEAYFGLLDAVVVIAEAWKLLVVACVLAVAAAFGYFQLQPETYQSDAVLSLDSQQLAHFSAPDFLERTGIDGAMWNLNLTHATGTLVPTAERYAVSFRASWPQAAQANLDAVIKAFIVEITPDAGRTEVLQLAKERIQNTLEDLSLIRANLATTADVEGVSPPRELYARSVALLLERQAKLEDELLDVGLQLKGGSEVVVAPPSSPSEPLPRSIRAILMASIGAAIFLVLSFAFAREAVRRAARTEAGAEKLMRVRRAFGLKNRS